MPVTRLGLDGGIATDPSNLIPVDPPAAGPITEPVTRLGIDGGIATRYTGAVQPPQAAVISAVSSSRGLNIIAANETLTITVDDSTDIAAVTVNAVACSSVLIVDGTTVSCSVPLGVLAPYGSAVDVVVNNGSDSVAHSATWEPPFGMIYTSLTVDYAGLDPRSPFAGNALFSGLGVGHVVIYGEETSPDSLDVLMDSTGWFTVQEPIPQQQQFDYYIYDASDQTVSATIQQITVEPNTSLVVSGSLHDHSSAEITLTQQYVLTLSESTHIHVSSEAALSQEASLALSDSLHSQESAEIALVQAYNLALSDGVHVHESAGFALTQEHVLALLGSLHSHESDAVALTAGLSLTLSDSVHTHESGLINLGQAHILALNDIVHGHESGEITLNQGYVLGLSDSLHGHESAGTALNVSALLALTDSVHAHDSEQVAISAGVALQLFNSVHGHESSEIDLSQEHYLIVSDSLHAHLSEATNIYDRSMVTIDQDRLMIKTKTATYIVLSRSELN